MAKKQVFNTSAELNYPSVLPTLDLDFANSKTLDPRITFRRSSSGTYFGPDGRLRYAGVNEPRFDHNPLTGECLGLLVEEQRTNLLLRSEELGTTWTPGNASVSSNSVSAPDGATSADKLIEDSSASTVHRIQQTVNFAASTVTYSVYLKAAGRNFALLVAFNGTNNRYIDCKFNLANGTVDTVVNGAASIQSVGNGWYRCSVTATTTVTANNILYVYAANVAGGGANYESYTGDGTSGIYVWGAQLEAGAFPTSYIPTTTAAATRSADVASISGSAFSGLYRQDEGTVFCEYIRPSAVDSARTMVAVSDGTFDNRTTFRTDSATAITIFARETAGIQAVFSLTMTSGAANRSIVAYKVNNFNAAVNGVTGVDDTSANVPTVDRMSIGSVLNTQVSCSYIRRLTYWPQRLPNSTLQALTQ